MQNDKKKTVLVTGASRSIGKAIAICLADSAANLVCCARNQNDLNQLSYEIEQIGVNAHTLALDLMKTNGVKNLISWLNENNLAPDIIVHNLGGSLGVTDVLSDQSAFAKVWKFNVGIGVEINRYFIPRMCDKNFGRIVHISTLSAKLHTGNLPYVSAKCALEGYVKNISKQFAKHNILINAVAPGLVDLPGRYYSELKDSDPMVLKQYFDDHLPLGRMINPSDVADVVKFLCFGESTVMSGAILPVDGGGY